MKREEIKKMLPVGFRKELSNRTGYSLFYIDRWFKYENNNINIEREALKYLAEILEERKVLVERVKAAL